MPAKRFPQIISELSFEKKLIAAGAALMAISLFLPWFSDVDSFHTGDTFTGLNGPLYFAGLTFLIISSLSLIFIVTDHLGIKLPLSSIKNSKIFLGFGIFDFYLLMMVNSVYFHHSFGVNITLKQSGFGTFVAFIAAALITVGGYMNIREKSTAWKEFEEETRDLSATRGLFSRDTNVGMPDVKMPSAVQQKPRENLRTVHPDPVKSSYSSSSSQPSIFPKTSNETPVSTSSNVEGKDPQPYRMDL